MNALSVIVPALDAARMLPVVLKALGNEAEIVVVDGGSRDHTPAVAAAAGARVVPAPRGRGVQLAAGANAAHGAWFLFLHSDTVLGGDWRAEAEAFMSDPNNRARAAAFRFALDDATPQARRLERIVAWRGRVLGLPYGDQGLLIHRDFYRALGGFRPLPLMEDVDFVRRIGHARLHILATPAITSAARWRLDGWLRRSLRNLTCLVLYFAGVPPRFLVRVYG